MAWVDGVIKGSRVVVAKDGEVVGPPEHGQCIPPEHPKTTGRLRGGARTG